MTKQTIRNFAFAAAAAAFLTAGTAQAEIRRSHPVVIPQDFEVNQVKLPAGQYLIEQDSMSELAALVNTKTGKKVYVLRPSNLRTPGKVTVTMSPGKAGMEVKVS